MGWFRVSCFVFGSVRFGWCVAFGYLDGRFSRGRHDGRLRSSRRRIDRRSGSGRGRIGRCSRSRIARSGRSGISRGHNYDEWVWVWV